MGRDLAWEKSVACWCGGEWVWLCMERSIRSWWVVEGQASGGRVIVCGAEVRELGEVR